MSWEIDRFGVKPTGFLADWRYARVMVDVNGNIEYLAIPGKPAIGNNCISDYKKNDRRYTEGQLIAEFCNLDTKTNFRVYAKNCKPFAYVQTDLDSPKCGYNEPLPQPAVPPQPFGTPTYGAYKHFTTCDVNNVPVEVKIFKRGYNGISTKINYAGASPIIISYKNTDDDKLAPIRACECKLTLVATENFSLQQFYTEDEREFKIEVKKNGKLKFAGFIIPDNITEEFISPPYDVTLRATDGLGALKKIAYPVPVGSSIDIRQTFLEIITYCLAMTNLNLDIATICNLYEAKMLNGIDDDPLAQAFVNPLRMSDNGKIFDCYAVLEKICLQFGAFLVQDNGIWNFVRQSEISNPVIRRRIYNDKALFLYSDQFQNNRIASCSSNDISILNESPTLSIGGAYKRAEVSVEFGKVPTIIYNGDFEIWDGHNFNYWTRYGGINISRVEKTIKTTTGEIPSGNYMLQFDEKVDNAKYLQANPIPVAVNDRIKMSYNIGTTDTNDLIFPKTAYLFKIRVKVGEYYLYNPDNGTTYEWHAELKTCTNFVDNFKGNINNYTVNFDIPPAPVSGFMTIQLYGFIKVRNTYFPPVLDKAALPIFKLFPAYYQFVLADDYTPITIDNIAISKTSEANNKEIQNVLHISQQEGFYTKTADPIKLLFGDYLEQGVTLQSNIDYQFIVNNLYAIYTSRTTDIKTTSWYEYGSSSAGLPIGLILAKSILKAYQKPFRFLSSGFLGDDISYLDIFNVDLPNNANFSERIFALLSGDLNLMTNELNNANYAEIFNRPAKSVDISIPSYPGDTSPIIIQNPNPSASTTEKIFTNQFTNQFL